MKLRKLSLATGVSLLALGLLGTAGPNTSESATDIMTKACDSYKGASSVKLRGLVTVDTFRADQKFQKNAVIDVLAKTPNKFKAVSQGDHIGGIVFDGTTISVFDTSKNFYAQAERKGDFHTFLDSSEELNVPTPMLDFIVSSNCHKAMEKATDAEVLPELVLDGVRVSHLLFTNATDKINWEAWVAMKDDRYVLKKIVITSMHLKEQPQYSFLLVSEQLNPEISDAEFDFTPTEGARKIEFMELLENRRGPPRDENPDQPGQDPDDPDQLGQDPDEPMPTTTTQAPTTTTIAPTPTTQVPTTTTVAPTPTTIAPAPAPEPEPDPVPTTTTSASKPRGRG